jgi:hypothetical protein
MRLLDMLLERELTPEQREAKRLRAKARREKRKAEGSSPIKPEYEPFNISNKEWLRRQWNKYNAMYFEGKMTEPKWFNTLSGSVLGRCSNDFDPQKNVIYCSAIYINKNIENYTTFRNTMVHEMVHQWCYAELNEDDIKHANFYGMARSRKWWKALTSPMGKDGHHGTWLSKCEELMAKYPELKLNKFGQMDEEAISDEEKEKTMKVNADCHIVLCEPGGGRRKYFYYITDSGFQELKSEIESGKKSGKWTEYKFDPEKLAKEKLAPVNHPGSSAWKGSYLEDLFERGVVKEWDYNELGGEKRQGRRSRFRLW